MEKVLTFEQIDEHIKKSNLEDFLPGGKHNLVAGTIIPKEDIGIKICGIYKIIRPILSGILLIPFITEKWKEALRVFMAFLDTLCPDSI